MTADEGSLLSLTKLLSEFHSIAVKPERRHSIQRILLGFEQTPNAWYSALYYLCSTSDKYVALYCLGVVESAVSKQWTVLADECKLELRRILHHYLVGNATNRQHHFLCRKVAKILASVARLDWPHAYPDFLDFVKSLLSPPFESDNDLLRVTVGLFTLQSVFEEFLQPNEMINSRRRRELRDLLIANAFSLYGALHPVAIHICRDSDLLEMAASSIMYSSVSSQLEAHFSKPLSAIFHLTEQFVRDQYTGSGLQSLLALTWLECLCELFKVLPIDTAVQHQLYGTLYIFSLLGSPAFLSACNLSACGTISTSPPSVLARLSMLALMAIQEVVERKDLTPCAMTQHLLYIFPIVQCHLSLITGAVVLPWSSTPAVMVTSVRSGGDLSGIVATNTETTANCNEHRLKLVDLLKCLMTNFFTYMIDMTVHVNSQSDAHAPPAAHVFEAARFLGLVHDFTFSSLELDAFFSCLGVWSAYFDFLTLRYKLTDKTLVCPNSQRLPQGLYSPVVSFGQTLLNRLYLSVSVGYLETLDNDSSEESYYWIVSADMAAATSLSPTDIAKSIFVQELGNCLGKPKEEPCEYRVFMRESLMVLQGAVAMAPADLLALIVQRYWHTYDDYVKFIQSFGLLSPPALTAKLLQSQPLHRTHWLIRDYATSLQVVGFVLDLVDFPPLNHMGTIASHQLSGPKFIQSLLTTLQISLRFLPSIASDGEVTKTPVLRTDLLELIVQTLLTLQDVVQGGYVICESPSAEREPSDRQCITLSRPDTESFCLELMRCLEQLIVPSEPLSIPTALGVRAAQLMECLIKSCLIANGNGNIWLGSQLLTTATSVNVIKTDESATVVSILFRLFSIFCDTTQRSRLHLCVQWTLSRMFFYSLGSFPLSGSDGGHQQGSSPHALLEHYLSAVFVPALSSTNPVACLSTAKDFGRYLVHLSLLTEGIQGLSTASGTLRNNVYSALVRSNLVDSIVASLDGLSSIVDTENGGNSSGNVNTTCLFAVYLTFFTAFAEILSHSDSKMASIPDLLARIIHALYSVTWVGGNSLTLSILDGLFSLFQLVCKNRRVLLPITGELLNLCIHRFLPTLAYESPPNELAKVLNEDERLSILVTKASQLNGASMENLYDLLFTILMNGFSYFFVKKPSVGSGEKSSSLFVPAAERYRLQHEEDFHRLMQVITAVFYTSQENSSLVRLVLDRLFSMHRFCNFYDLPVFNQTWLPTIAKQLMDCLVRKEHSSCQDEMVDGLYQLFTAGRLPQNLPSVEAPGFSAPQQPVTFISYFLSAYLDSLSTWLMQLDGVQRDTLLGEFYSCSSRGQDGASSVSCSAADFHADAGALKAAVERFTTDLRCLHAMQMMNSAETCALPSFPV